MQVEVEVQVQAPGVVALLHHEVGDGRLVPLLQVLARRPDRHLVGRSHARLLESDPGGTHQLRGEHGEELALGHAVPEHDQPLRLPPVVLLVELEEERLGDGPHVLDHLLVPVQPRVLDPHLVQVVLRQVQVVHVEMV